MKKSKNILCTRYTKASFEPNASYYIGTSDENFVLCMSPIFVYSFFLSDLDKIILEF